MKFKKISADEAREVRRSQFRGDSNVMLKAARGPSTWDDDKRSARFVMSSQSVDRYGDVVVTDGLRLDEFVQNPVALLSHRSTDWPIGDWKNIEKLTRTRPPRLEGDLVLHEAGPIEVINQAEHMIKNGFMRGASIGFIPNFDAIEMIFDDGGDAWTGGLKFNEATIVECSLCAVPANQDSLAKMDDRGSHLAMEFVEEILETWEKSADGVLIPRQTGKSALEYAEMWAKTAGMELLNPEIDQRIPKKQYMQMQSLAAHNRRVAQLRRELDIRKSRTF